MIDSFIQDWQEQASRLRDMGLSKTANTLYYFIRDLDAFWVNEWEEPLTVQEAAKWSGYSESSIRRLLSENPEFNMGEEGNPRIARADLPVKAGRLRENLTR